jgi:hypothetical protein
MIKRGRQLAQSSWIEQRMWRLVALSMNTVRRKGGGAMLEWQTDGMGRGTHGRTGR